VKANPAQGQDRYVIGGLAIPLEAISELEARCGDLAESIFGNRLMAPETEFHASHIYSGKGPYKGRPVADRIKLLAELGQIINSNTDVRRIYAEIRTDRLYAGANAPKMAFAYFCERVQMATGKTGSTLLIGDYDDQGSRQMIREFSHYRAVGNTPWDFGIPIPSIVDAVHFVPSHHSRMIQLADVYLFLLTHGWGGRKGWMADELSKAIKDIALYGHRYKTWPNE
jgi:hypothetical protein